MDDPDYDPNLPPSSKRTDSSLKPRRTTRTMNPLTKSTMKHVNMISKTHEGTYQKVISRSASKSIDETMDMEDLEYGEDVPEPDEGSDDLDETCADMNDAVSKVDRYDSFVIVNCQQVR